MVCIPELGSRVQRIPGRRNRCYRRLSNHTMEKCRKHRPWPIVHKKDHSKFYQGHSKKVQLLLGNNLTFHFRFQKTFQTLDFHFQKPFVCFKKNSPSCIVLPQGRHVRRATAYRVFFTTTAAFGAIQVIPRSYSSDRSDRKFRSTRVSYDPSGRCCVFSPSTPKTKHTSTHIQKQIKTYSKTVYEKQIKFSNSRTQD